MFTALGRAALKKRRDVGFDLRHKKLADSAYQAITRAEPDRTLSASTRKHIREYARDHFGSVMFAPWLYTYAAWRGEFVEGCLPDNYVGRFLAPYSVGMHKAATAHTMARRAFLSDRFPDLGYVFHGKLYDLDGIPLDPAEAAKTWFADHEALYVKSDDSRQGLGVTRTQPARFADDVGKLSSGVVQYPLSMHPDLKEFCPGPAPTLRITTVNIDGNVRDVAAFLKFGLQSDTHVQSTTSVKVVIDRKDGTMHKRGSLADWTPVETHPETGAAFSGRAIPNFSEVLRVCREHHARFPAIRYIGWDVAVTETGRVMFFETNSGHSGVKFSEAEHGPVFEGLGWDRLHLTAPPR
ncbi:MAG: sugar-transfer associated ATP-grasp domain-containing protein [Pseudomonadota bacterium]